MDLGDFKYQRLGPTLPTNGLNSCPRILAQDVERGISLVNVLPIFLWALVALSCAASVVAIVVAPVWEARRRVSDNHGKGAIPLPYAHARAHMTVVVASAIILKLVVMAVLACVKPSRFRRRQVGGLLFFGAGLFVEVFVFGLTL